MARLGHTLELEHDRACVFIVHLRSLFEQNDHRSAHAEWMGVGFVLSKSR